MYSNTCVTGWLVDILKCFVLKVQVSTFTYFAVRYSLWLHQGDYVFGSICSSVYSAGLKKKLKKNPCRPDFHETLWKGVGQAKEELLHCGVDPNRGADT